LPAPDFTKPAGCGEIFEYRMLITEARVEALKDHVHRIEGLREETLRLGILHRQELSALPYQ
jgi:hypothetical protein